MSRRTTTRISLPASASLVDGVLVLGPESWRAAEVVAVERTPRDLPAVITVMFDDGSTCRVVFAEVGVRLARSG